MKSQQKFFIVSIVLFLLLHNFVVGQNKGDDISIGKYDKISSKILNEERTLMISFPSGYESSQEKYPVLYLLDGDVSLIAESHYWLNNFYRLFPKMIVVAIKNTNRNRDVLPGQGSEGARNFLKFMREELFPYIEKNYRTDSFRILYGASNAGVFVVYSLLENPDTYSAYIASSPTILWRYDYMVDKINETFSSQSNLNKFFYVIYGDKDWSAVRDTLYKFIPLLEKLKTKGLKLQTKYLPDENHVPDASLFNGIKYIFDGYTYPEEKASNEGLDSLKAYYDRFSKNLNYKMKIPLVAFTRLGNLLTLKSNFKEAIKVYEAGTQTYPEEGRIVVQLAITYYRDGNKEMSKIYFDDLKNNHKDIYKISEGHINGLGYNLIALKKFDEAIDVFKLNVEMFPDSWNAYDSLGEAYMNAGNKNLAIENYEKVLKLNPKNSGAIEQLKKLKKK